MRNLLKFHKEFSYVHFRNETKPIPVIPKGDESSFYDRNAQHPTYNLKLQFFVPLRDGKLSLSHKILQGFTSNYRLPFN